MTNHTFSFAEADDYADLVQSRDTAARVRRLPPRPPGSTPDGFYGKDAYTERQFNEAMEELYAWGGPQR